ncbi:MAG: NAD(P)/FAD-dependent oxidoreductase [Bryobacter sp.]|nr:NAD(P)/FAD-dependent oxidoreductase [Bryobacter sp.]
MTPNSTRDATVVIIGAGLAGLACARELHQRRIPFLLLEASDRLGGRVRTDAHEGFLLDRGFQVYLTAYPEGRRVFDYAALRFGAFLPGALVRFQDRFHRVMDPWRQPLGALASLLNPVGSMVDKMRVAGLRAASLAGQPEQLFTKPETSARAALLRYGFSEAMIQRFFQPFFGGIMLDRDLKPSSRMLEFVFRMMATGDTVLPAEGMEALPRSLAAALPPNSLRCGCPVASFAAGSVQLSNGETLAARAVVLATDGPTAHRLHPAIAPVNSRGVNIAYFAVSGPPPITEPIIILNGNPSGLIQNLSFPSVVSPTYAPAGQHLAGATVLGGPRENLAEEVRQELRTWFGPTVDQWRPLRTYHIPHAHPAFEPETATAQPLQLAPGLFVCGDHRFFPSLQAALSTGRQAAEAVAASLA